MLSDLTNTLIRVPSSLLQEILRKANGVALYKKKNYFQQAVGDVSKLQKMKGVRSMICAVFPQHFALQQTKQTETQRAQSSQLRRTACKLLAP